MSGLTEIRVTLFAMLVAPLLLPFGWLLLSYVGRKLGPLASGTSHAAPQRPLRSSTAQASRLRK